MPCLDCLGKIERYRIFHVIIIKINLFESVSICFILRISHKFEQGVVEKSEDI